MGVGGTLEMGLFMEVSGSGKMIFCEIGSDEGVGGIIRTSNRRFSFSLFTLVSTCVFPFFSILL